MKLDPLRCRPLPPHPEWRKVLRGQTPMPTNPMLIWLLRTNPTPQRGRGSIRTQMPLLLFLYVVFVALCVLCCVDLDVLINCVVFIKNQSPPPAPAPVLTLNGTIAHPPMNPTPTHTQPPASNFPGTPSLTQAQHKFCLSTLRNLKKSKDARPFMYPVDIVAMNIPHYPEIVTHPMDLSTIEDKLNSSNPAKPDPNPEKPRYYTADQFIADVRLVFSNCIKFNGSEHAISLMGRRLEELFDKSIKNIPPPEEAKPVPVKKAPPPAPAPPPTTVAPAKQRAPRRPSTSTPVIRRNESISAGGSRPKREIHPPPSKDLPYADVPKKSRKARAAKDNLNAEQLRFCSKLLSDLHRKAHWNVASPFYEPVGTSMSFLRTSELFLTITLCRLCWAKHSVLPQDHQGTHGPLYDAEEAGQSRVFHRSSFFC